ncbi:penicillin-binding protein [Halolactibacillus halophilus]|uniref:Penicillin-binding protein n=1 Tax=Halolactibacillus halophilus TaxID=306540 RepID=A0A1I5Q1M5_9BACI|nr:transglycosylase domain-containing protein [Halolactibacillus halophilus]GEM01943.1 hypothetical protein HHA03_14750 [Halolactibacillus halophilus]SFP40133.1 penicillin-binding protein [Halolactibacillus halophilus]
MNQPNKDTLKQLWEKLSQKLPKIFRISYDVTWNILLFFIILFVVGGFFVGGLGAGYFAALVKDEPLRSEKDMTAAIYNYEATSEIYFANDIFMGEVGSDIYREETTIDHVSQNIINGVIATEDEYFNEHNGIVPKAIMRAVFQELTGAATQTGGSTLTQQIIKNQILTNEVSFDRKAKEILLALRVENFMEKDDILEAYLNIVPFGRDANGRNISGVQTASEGIFGVDADEVNLAQAAFIAGLPQSPIMYSPFTNGGQLKSDEGLAPGLERMQTVLERMVRNEYITQAQYEEALEFDLVESFTEGAPSTFERYPYLTQQITNDAADIIKERLAIEDGYTLEELNSNESLIEQYEILANREISQGGYKIHTTIVKDIHDVFQEVKNNFSNYGPNKIATIKKEDGTTKTIMTEDPETGELIPYDAPVQVGSFLRDNETGAILAFVGGRDFDLQNRNFAMNAPRQMGSTAKPLLVYAPSFEEGILQPGSIIADAEFRYSDASGPWTPSNYSSSRYYGLTTVRNALKRSYNVTAARAYIDLLAVANPVPDYLLKMGFTNFPESNYRFPSMALGSHNATVEENTNGYSTFGNDGQYTDSFMISKIENVDGEEIYAHESTTERVFSTETNYLVIDMMRDVLSSGTGNTARRNLTNPGVDWAGKTGTSNDFKDTWFIATNPNVTLGSWMGYEYEQQLNTGYSGRNQVFWAQLVNAATEVAPEIMAPSENFTRPNNVVSRSFSLVSGMSPSSLTSELGLVGSDIFNSKYVPKKQDYSIISANVVNVGDNAVLVDDQTPNEFTSNSGYMFNPDWLKDKGYDELIDITDLYPSREGGWGRLLLPDLSDEDIQDNGERPLTPTGVSKSGNVLTWQQSRSENVIGYRIYRANDPESNFSLLDSTTNNQYNVGNSPAVYQIRAVDYFGRESQPSNPFVDGDFTEEEPEAPEQPEAPDDEDTGDTDDTPTPPDENQEDDDQTDDDTVDDGQSDDETPEEPTDENPNTPTP